MAKGGGFEIKVARMFTKWVTGKEKPEIVWRSISLGPKATMDRRRGGEIRKIGDLVAIDPKGQWIEDTFFIECKHHRKADLMDLMKNNSSKNKTNVRNWWLKCKRESEEASKYPLLVFHGDNQPIMAMADNDMFRELNVLGHLTHYFFYKEKRDPGALAILNPVAVLFLFEELLNILDPKTVEAVLRK